MAGSSGPVWKQLFDAAERTIGSRINEFARSENYAILMRIALLSSLNAQQTTRNLGFRCARDAHSK